MAFFGQWSKQCYTALNDGILLLEIYIVNKTNAGICWREAYCLLLGTLFTARQFATFFEVIQPAVFMQICEVYYAMFSKQSYILHLSYLCA